MHCMTRWFGRFEIGHFKLFIVGLILGSVVWSTSLAQAQTRRAFVVGVQRYSDGNIQQLRLSTNDAKDLARDLEQIGFEKKNIKIVTDPRSKEAFNREFSAFLKTVQAGDTVVFFFAGHGFGVETDQTNYLLLGDLKSPFAYTKSQLPDRDRRNNDLVRLRMASHLRGYE